MLKSLVGRIVELARRREVAAAAVLLLTGGLIWLAVDDSTPAVQENSLDAMRFSELGTATDAKAGHGAALPGATDTARRIPPVDNADAARPSMSAWMLSNGALDLNGEFVPPPIQVALTRNPPVNDLSPSRQSAGEEVDREIQQLQMEVDPSIPTARFTGVTLDGEATGP